MADDVRLIALAHNALPALIAEVRELRAYREEVEANIPTVQALLDSGERAQAEAAGSRLEGGSEVELILILAVMAWAFWRMVRVPGGL